MSCMHLEQKTVSSSSGCTVDVQVVGIEAPTLGSTPRWLNPACEDLAMQTTAKNPMFVAASAIAVCAVQRKSKNFMQQIVSLPAIVLRLHGNSVGSSAA